MKPPADMIAQCLCGHRQSVHDVREQQCVKCKCKRFEVDNLL